MDADELLAYKVSARDSAQSEMLERFPHFLDHPIVVTEINEAAIDSYETWLNDEFDFGFERVIGWKRRPAHAKAIDIAVWCGDLLAGLCWASPQDSPNKILVLYLQRNPDDTLPTRGYIAPICLTAVRNYALLLDLKWVVIQDPNPDAREAYFREQFHQVPGIGLAYDLTNDYAALDEEVDDHER
ncbi:hypothetical protein ACNFBT_17270 [Pseudomonas sp. NY15181]|uniref:hypothetical protein n=1 Tax=Pseudomonas sp. NY15181 TaxID=3400349 RepID=UPI003A849BD4